MSEKECQSCKGHHGEPVDNVRSYYSNAVPPSEKSLHKGEVVHNESPLDVFSKTEKETLLDAFKKPSPKEDICKSLIAQEVKQVDLEDGSCKRVSSSVRCEGTALSPSWMSASGVKGMTILGRLGNRLTQFNKEGWLYSFGNGLVEIVPEMKLKLSKLWNKNLNGVIQSPEDFQFEPVAGEDGEIRGVVGLSENIIKMWDAQKQCWTFVTPQELLSGLITNGIDGTNGINGQDGVNGTDGEDGAGGESAYDIWLRAGNIGSEQVFLDSLKGVGCCGDGCGCNDQPDGLDNV